MILVYLIVGLVLTTLLFLWFEGDCAQCPFHKYLPDNPDFHTYIYLFVWLTWIISLPIIIIAASHMMHIEQDKCKGKYHDRRDEE